MSDYPQGNGKPEVFAVAQCTVNRAKSASGQKWAVACYYDLLVSAIDGAVKMAKMHDQHATIVVRMTYSGITTQVESFGLEGLAQPECAYQGLFAWPNYARSWAIWEAAARFALQDDPPANVAALAEARTGEAPEPSWLLVWRDNPAGMPFVGGSTATNDRHKARRFATREEAASMRRQYAWMQDFEPIREDQI